MLASCPAATGCENQAGPAQTALKPMGTSPLHYHREEYGGLNTGSGGQVPRIAASVGIPWAWACAHACACPHTHTQRGGKEVGMYTHTYRGGREEMKGRESGGACHTQPHPHHTSAAAYTAQGRPVIPVYSKATVSLTHRPG